MMNWPFVDPRNTAAITLHSIMSGDQPILYVTHDSEDGEWQFLGWQTPDDHDAMIVALEEVCAKDPTVAQVADLPLGWHAWREARDQPWKRSRNEEDKT